jgi:hypothetical protein
MFDWLRRALRSPEDDDRQRFFRKVDALNAQTLGGGPVARTQFLGRLKLRSGTLVLSDPQYVPDLEIPNIVADEVAISASLRQYPSGAQTVTALRLDLGEATGDGAGRKVGELGIDSATLVVADKADIEEHWTETGKDRIGVISTAPDDTLLRLLTKRFKLRTVRANPIRAEVVGPVSEQLEAEIEAFLKADPKYAAFPYMHFRVETNNSFERTNLASKTWDFIPVGNSPEPLMFVCGTGRGDGCYDVFSEYEGDIPHALTITFIED